jgi:hypothetical protein
VIQKSPTCIINISSLAKNDVFDKRNLSAGEEATLNVSFDIALQES